VPRKGAAAREDLCWSGSCYRDWFMKARPFALTLFVFGVGCGQTLGSNHPGTGGAGTGGLSGAGGIPGRPSLDAGSLCELLASQYSAELAAAQSCDVGSKGECQQVVDWSLSPCGGCPTFVHDATVLNAIQQSWLNAGCANVTPAPPCALIECPAALNDVCLATDGGHGICSYSPNGAGGSPADAGSSSCDDLQSQYAATLTAAQSCDPNGSAQCQQLVSSSLSPCSSCTTYVNEASALSAIEQKWQQAECGNVAVACPAIACVPPSSATCFPADGGGGLCVRAPVLLETPSR
jgi:hypothetical protein